MKHPTLGRDPKHIQFSVLLSHISPLAQVKVFTQLQNDPAISGFILFARQELGMDAGYSMMPFGPNCHTFKSLEDALGVPLGGTGAPLTDPPYAVKWSNAPVSVDYEAAIRECVKRGMAELPTIWKGRKKYGLWLKDNFLNPETNHRLVVLTYGENEASVLVVAEQQYSEELVPDDNSPTGKSKKNSEHWAWMSLPDIVAQGYTLLERQGIPVARFVDTRGQER